VIELFAGKILPFHNNTTTNQDSEGFLFMNLKEELDSAQYVCDNTKAEADLLLRM
jgi:hypothetical protein